MLLAPPRCALVVGGGASARALWAIAEAARARARPAGIMRPDDEDENADSSGEECCWCWGCALLARWW